MKSRKYAAIVLCLVLLGQALSKSQNALAMDLLTQPPQKAAPYSTAKLVAPYIAGLPDSELDLNTLFVQTEDGSFRYNDGFARRAHLPGMTGQDRLVAVDGVYTRGISPERLNSLLGTKFDENHHLTFLDADNGSVRAQDLIDLRKLLNLRNNTGMSPLLLVSLLACKDTEFPTIAISHEYYNKDNLATSAQYWEFVRDYPYTSGKGVLDSAGWGMGELLSFADQTGSFELGEAAREKAIALSQIPMNDFALEDFVGNLRAARYLAKTGRKPKRRQCTVICCLPPLIGVCPQALLRQCFFPSQIFWSLQAGITKQNRYSKNWLHDL